YTPRTSIRGDFLDVAAGDVNDGHVLRRSVRRVDLAIAADVDAPGTSPDAFERLDEGTSGRVDDGHGGRAAERHEDLLAVGRQHGTHRAGRSWARALW